MQTTNLVGQTVRFSYRNNKEGGYDTKTVFLIKEWWDANRRYYRARDMDSMELFDVIADKYDEYFLTNRSLIRPEHHREAIQNKSQIDYKK